MLSRRNVRIKIMQVLYATRRETGEGTLTKRRKTYDRLVSRSFQLYLQNLLILQRVAAYAKQDQARRLNKLRPTERDRNFTAKIALNPATASLLDNPELSQVYDKKRVSNTIDAELIGKLYRDFAKTEDYEAYVYQPDTTLADDRKILLTLYKWMQGQERFMAMIEDHFPLWDEDKSLIVGAIKKTIKALPATENFLEAYQQPSATVTEFGSELLRFVTEADEQLMSKIGPVLENWDPERVAVIDMILIKMALTEFLRFEDVPGNVSLNEYVEISKQYSTDKSREFINGVLDKLLKQLRADGLVSEA